jgi:hypothetical protein
MSAWTLLVLKPKPAVDISNDEQTERPRTMASRASYESGEIR